MIYYQLKMKLQPNESADSMKLQCFIQQLELVCSPAENRTHDIKMMHLHGATQSRLESQRVITSVDVLVIVSLFYLQVFIKCFMLSFQEIIYNVLITTAIILIRLPLKYLLEWTTLIRKDHILIHRPTDLPYTYKLL